MDDEEFPERHENFNFSGNFQKDMKIFIFHAISGK
jgi:hypothetical protein